MGYSEFYAPSFYMSYETMKARQKNLLRERTYYTYLLTCLSSAFNWTVPEDVEVKYLEKFLHEQGSFAAQKTEKGYLIAPAPSRAGELNQYGDGNEIYGVTRGNGYQIKGTYNVDVAICYNNIDRTPDYDLIRYADAFSQIDKAIMANVHWTILAPVLCATDSKVADNISKLCDDMLEGKLKCITSRDVLDSLRPSSSASVYSVDITHPERIKNVQYQSELYDVMFRRFFNKYGLNIQNTSKHAQATADEVHGLDSVAWVYILDMLRSRQEFCKDISRITGDVWECKFSDIWETEYEAYKRRSCQVDTPETTDVENVESEGEVNDGESMDEN